MKKIQLLLFLWAIISSNLSITASDNNSTSVCVNEEEIALFHLINAYRMEKDLPSIALSSSLTKVAQIHCEDLNNNPPDRKKCNLHSWSKNGQWSRCCYTPNHKHASCMWDKPRELTNYTGDGFEIAFAKYKSDNSTPVITAQEAFDSWKKSKGHNMVMVNKGNFKKMNWQAIGVGIVDGNATVWFGIEQDESPSPVLCSTISPKDSSLILPDPFGIINDFENIFTEKEIELLTDKVLEITKTTGVQVAIVSIESIAPYESMFDYSLAIAQKWSPGSKDKNDGILIALSKARREIHIQIGTGLEESVSNKKTKEIIDHFIIPKFRTNNYFLGINEGLIAFLQILKRN